MREMICNLALILHYITLSNKTYNVTELSHTPYDGIRTYHNLNIYIFFFEYTCSIVNLPHKTTMRGIVHNVILILHSITLNNKLITLLSCLLRLVRKSELIIILILIILLPGIYI